jgi:hypothetical protein
MNKTVAWNRLPLFPVFLFSVLASCTLLVGVGGAADPSPEPLVSTAPSQGTRDVHLHALWTAGLDDDLIFGRIRGVVERKDGDVCVLDAQLNQIQVFSPEGEWQKTIGREGEAPGEFRNPSSLFLGHDGTLDVIQTMPPKIALLKPDGVPLDDHPIPDPSEGVPMLTGGYDRGSDLVLAASGMFFADGKMGTVAQILSVDDKGTIQTHYYEDRHPVDLAAEQFKERDMTGVSGVWTVTAKGNVVVAEEWDAYRLHVYAPDGSLLRIIERPFEPHVRTPEERKYASKRYSMNINGKQMKVQVSDTDRVVDGLYPLPDGGFQVLIRERQPDDPPELFARLDQFDAQGRWVQQWRLYGDVDLNQDRIFPGKNRMYVAHNVGDTVVKDEDEDAEADMEPLHLVCYRLDS